MNAAIVSRTLSLIPDRVPRMQSGSTFDPSAAASCSYPERIAHLAQFLGWLERKWSEHQSAKEAAKEAAKEHVKNIDRGN